MRGWGRAVPEPGAVVGKVYLQDQRLGAVLHDSGAGPGPVGRLANRLSHFRRPGAGVGGGHLPGLPPADGTGGAPQQVWLAFGLVCFGLGHLVYTGMFLARADWALWPLLAAPVLPVVLWLLIRLGFCWPEPAAIAVGTYLYAAVVGVMAGGAAFCVLFGEGPDLWLAAALLFVVSDSTLTRTPSPWGAGR